MDDHPPRPRGRAGETHGRESVSVVDPAEGPDCQAAEIPSSDHLKNTKPLVESGFMVLGGAMLEEPTAEGKPLKINGSILMAAADTREQVLERLKEDVYYKGDVWDKEKASEVQRAHVGRAWSKDDVG